VAEEAVLMGKSIAVEAKGATNLLDDLCAWLIGSLVCNAEGGESEACGSNAGHSVGVERSGVVDPLCAIKNLAGARTDLLGKVETASPFEIVEEGFVGRREWRGGRCGRKREHRPTKGCCYE
jgi:hypothetical protein